MHLPCSSAAPRRRATPCDVALATGHRHVASELLEVARERDAQETRDLDALDALYRAKLRRLSHLRRERSAALSGIAAAEHAKRGLVELGLAHQAATDKRTLRASSFRPGSRGGSPSRPASRSSSRPASRGPSRPASRGSDDGGMASPATRSSPSSRYLSDHHSSSETAAFFAQASRDSQRSICEGPS